MGKLFLSLSFFVLAPILIVFNIVFFSYVSYHQSREGLTKSLQESSKKLAYAALPQTQATFENEFEEKDARIEIVRQFLDKYNSPLTSHADHIVAEADENGLDYRLIPAIAMQESGLCRRIPIGSHNCWGFGIYGGKVIRFENYEQGITTVTKSLANKYKKNGLETPEEIMSKYTPGSNGSWAFAVNHFMDELSLTP